MAFFSKTYSTRLLKLISWSHWFTFFNIIAAIGFSTIYLFSEPAPETLLGQVYLVTNWLSHMAFLTFISFMLIVFPITILFPYTRFIRGSASVVFTIGLLLLVLDAYIYSKLGYHLNASSSDQIIDLINSQIEQNSRTFWFVTLVLSILILNFQLVVSNYAWKHLHELQKSVYARYVVVSLVAAFFFSHLTHIWADAKLDYDVLRQDTVLPLSYPATAKTLLTKYGLFDREAYIERRNSPLSFTDKMPSYPAIGDQCSAENTDQAVFMVLSKSQLAERQLNQISQRAHPNHRVLTRHIDDANSELAWFNLFYSLPSLYQDNILSQSQAPVLFQQLSKAQLTTALTVISDAEKSMVPEWVENLFAKKTQLNNISSLVFADKLNSYAPGLHVFYFDDSSDYQLELFMDALLLAQQQKAKANSASNQDIIWLSALGNQDTDTRLSAKSALIVLPEHNINPEGTLTSQMDVMPTLMQSWLDCQVSTNDYSSGNNMLSLPVNRVVANSNEQGIVIFNKDKSVFVDQLGNFQSYSRQLSAPIETSKDFPLLIDGMNFIKAFANRQQQAQAN